MHDDDVSINRFNRLVTGPCIHTLSFIKKRYKKVCTLCILILPDTFAPVSHEAVYIPASAGPH